MKRQAETDERILQEKRKVQSDVCQLLVCGLLLATLIQQYFFHAPLAQYAVELVAALLTAGYVVVRNLIAGNNTETNAPAKRTLLGALGSGAVVAVLLVVLAGFNAVETAVFILCYVPISFLVVQGLSSLSARRRKKLDRELGGDE